MLAAVTRLERRARVEGRGGGGLVVEAELHRLHLDAAAHAVEATQGRSGGIKSMVFFLAYTILGHACD